MARRGVDLGGKVQEVIKPFIVLVVLLALATNLSPTIVEYIRHTGEQMKNDTSSIVQALGNIFYDYGPVVWYGGLMGGAFTAIYAIVKKIF